MSIHWQELLPADSYQVSAEGILHDYDRKILTRLYQPLIGPVCLSLYMSLWSELEDNRITSETTSHYSLMHTMSLNLREIYEARLLLEGIGLLKVYRQENGEQRDFVYQLCPPLSPEQFFNDGMLNIYLYKKVGKSHYNRLKNFFSDNALPIGEYENVTKPFADVFSSEHSVYVSDEGRLDEKSFANKQFIQKPEAKFETKLEEQFDFDMLLAGLHTLVQKKAFTPHIKMMIAKLAFLYDISVLDMQKLILSSVNAEDEIDEELLRKSARDWYRIERNVDMPSLVHRTQPLMYRTQVEEPVTPEEKHIHHLETVSPLQRFQELSNGSEVVEADLKIIENLLLQQKLNPGVVNVLIEYVMVKTENKFTKGYVEKIAGQWARSKVLTVKDAMEIARKEHKNSLKRTEKKTNQNSKRKAATRTEIVPEWLHKEEEPKQKNDDPEAAERKRKLLQRLERMDIGGEKANEKD